MIRVHGADRADRGWVSAVAPTAEEITALTTRYHVPATWVEHGLDPGERPRTEVTKDGLFVVLRVPIAHPPSAPLPYTTCPLALVLCHDLTVTLCAQDNEVLAALRTYAQEEWQEARHPRLILHALEATADAYLRRLVEIDTALAALESRLQGSTSNREVMDMLRYQKGLVYFTVALQSTEHMLEALLRGPLDHLSASDRTLLEQVLVEFRQAIERATIQSSLLSGLMDAYASIVSNNLNQIMRVLTGATLAVTIPVTIASLWGMNVAVPGAGEPLAFAFLTASSLVAAIAIAFGMRRFGWI